MNETGIRSGMIIELYANQNGTWSAGSESGTWSASSESGMADITAWVDQKKDVLCIKLRYYSLHQHFVKVPEGDCYPTMPGSEAAQIIEQQSGSEENEQ